MLGLWLVSVPIEFQCWSWLQEIGGPVTGGLDKSMLVMIGSDLELSNGLVHHCSCDLV